MKLKYLVKSFNVLVILVMCILFNNNVAQAALNMPVGSYIKFGNWGGTPITWQVVSNDGTYTRLVATLSITTAQYLGADWGNSSIRSLLNESVYLGFKELEREAINLTRVSFRYASGSTGYSDDYISLISIFESSNLKTIMGGKLPSTWTRDMASASMVAIYDSNNLESGRWVDSAYHIVPTLYIKNNSINYTGDGTSGNPYIFITQIAPNNPSAFTNLISTTKVKGGELVITWGTTSNWQTGTATSRQYELQFYNGSLWSSSVFTSKSSSPSNSYTYNIPNNINVTTAAFRVRAVTDHGSSSWITSNNFTVDNTVPNAITPTVTVNSSTQITVSGTTTDILSGLHTTQPYNIGYRKIGDANWIDMGWGTSTSRVITGLSPNVQYEFRIQSQDVVGNISEGNIVNKYTLANIPGNISFNNVLDKSLILSVNSNNNSISTQYYVERALNSSFSNITKVQDWNTNISINDIDLIAGTVYYYRVKARNGDNIETNYNTIVNQKTTESPVVSNVVLNGVLKIGNILTVNYSYNDVDNDLELGTQYKWYRDGAVFSINSSKTYILKEEDKFKDISVGVIPKSNRIGESVGLEVKSVNYYIVPNEGQVEVIVKDTIGNLIKNVEVINNN